MSATLTFSAGGGVSDRERRQRIFRMVQFRSRGAVRGVELERRHAQILAASGPRAGPLAAERAEDASQRKEDHYHEHSAGEDQHRLEVTRTAVVIAHRLAERLVLAPRP